MLDHLIFNKLKWYNVADNAEKMTINGKNWIALPTKITVKSDAIANTLSGSVYRLTNDATLSVKGILNGQYIASGEIEVQSYSSDTEKINAIFTVDKSDIKNVIWGVTALLSQLWQRLRHAFTSRNEVRA